MIPLKCIISLLKKSCRIQQIVLFDEISNIMRSIPLRFRVECLGNILFKKCGISNQPVAASDSVSFQVWSTPTGHVRTPEDNL